MDAQKVDNAHLYGFIVDLDLAWCSRDKAEQFLLASGSDTDVPVLVVAWDKQAPSDEPDGVVEAEEPLRVFYIMLAK